MGCSQRTGHGMCAPYMHLSHSCQTVSLPYALMSTEKINHPPTRGEGGTKKTYKVPRDLLLINNIHFLPHLQYTRYDTMIQLLGCSTQWVMKNIHHYISEYINIETSINCSHMSHLPTSIIIFWSTKNMKKRYKIHCSSEHHFITSNTQNSWSWSTPSPELSLLRVKNNA